MDEADMGLIIWGGGAKRVLFLMGLVARNWL